MSPRHLTPTLTLILALGLPATLVGCAGESVLQEYIVPMHDTFVVARPDEVDVLFVIDNSGSMEEEQDETAVQFEAFVEHFAEAQVDYHLGVTTTDTDSDADAGRLVGDPPWITAGTPEGAAAFRDAVAVGTDGSQFERCLLAAIAALSPGARAEMNAGFWRPTAALVVVFVSDEDDVSAGAADEYLDALNELQADGGGSPPTLHALVAYDEDEGEATDCDEVNDAEAGYRYVELVEATGGVAASICTGNFSEAIGAMGAHAVEPPTRSGSPVVRAGSRSPCGSSCRVRRRSPTAWSSPPRGSTATTPGGWRTARSPPTWSSTGRTISPPEARGSRSTTTLGSAPPERLPQSPQSEALTRSVVQEMPVTRSQRTSTASPSASEIGNRARSPPSTNDIDTSR